jgi:predicted RNase H-like HicB family nuclease
MHDINLSTIIFREGKYFIAYSPVLDLSTSGKSFEEATRRFREAVKIFFEEIKRKGTLKEVLSDLGWTRVQNRWLPPVIVASELEKFRVPVAA